MGLDWASAHGSFMPDAVSVPTHPFGQLAGPKAPPRSRRVPRPGRSPQTPTAPCSRTAPRRPRPPNSPRQSRLGRRVRPETRPPGDRPRKSPFGNPSMPCHKAPAASSQSSTASIMCIGSTSIARIGVSTSSYPCVQSIGPGCISARPVWHISSVEHAACPSGRSPSWQSVAAESWSSSNGRCMGPRRRRLVARCGPGMHGWSI
jgi:hypothetical protein